jgi:hypothetical protein
MISRGITRRASLLLPLLVAACGSNEPREFPPLRYTYLPPLRLKVATIDIEQRFIPSGVPPDVSPQDPVPPVQALRQMAEDRLQAFGTTGRAVFSIQDASLIRQDDTVIGNMAVGLDIYTSDNTRAGFAEARVSRRRSGNLGDLPSALYDMTRAMMDDMNVEFEYQVRRSLKDWLATTTAVPAPVEAQPLTQ